MTSRGEDVANTRKRVQARWLCTCGSHPSARMMLTWAGRTSPATRQRVGRKRCQVAMPNLSACQSPMNFAKRCTRSTHDHPTFPILAEAEPRNNGCRQSSAGLIPRWHSTTSRPRSRRASTTPVSSAARPTWPTETSHFPSVGRPVRQKGEKTMEKQHPKLGMVGPEGLEPPTKRL